MWTREGRPMDQWGKEVVQDYDVLTGWQEGLIFLYIKIEKSLKF